MLKITKVAAIAAAAATGIGLMLAGPAAGAPGGNNSLHRYQVVSTAVSWDAANAAAMAAGGHLVTITSQKEQDRIISLMSQTGFTSAIWLGGSDASQEGVWRWVDGGVFYIDPTDEYGNATGIPGPAVRGYSNWDQNTEYLPSVVPEPTNGGGVENCLVMQNKIPTVPKSNFTWMDDECNGGTYGTKLNAYIIEFD